MAQPTDPPIGVVTLSALAIITVTLVLPMLTGGAITFAAKLGDEIITNEYPNSNGTTVTDIGYDTSLVQGDCTVPIWYPNAQVITINGNYFNGLAHPYEQGGSSSNDCLALQLAAPREFNLGLPSDTFVSTGDYSSFTWEWYNAGGISGSDSSNMDAGYTFDYWLSINATKVFGAEDVSTDGFKYRPDLTRVVSFWDFNHSMTIVDLNNVKEETDKCEPSCIVTLSFDNMSRNGYIGQDYSNYPWDTQAGLGYTRLVVMETDDISATLVMQVTPWVLGGLFMLISLGSTALWNPMKGFIGNRIQQPRGVSYES